MPPFLIIWPTSQERYMGVFMHTDVKAVEESNSGGRSFDGMTRN